jgi:chromosome segregation ATPase
LEGVKSHLVEELRALLNDSLGKMCELESRILDLDKVKNVLELEKQQLQSELQRAIESKIGCDSEVQEVTHKMNGILKENRHMHEQLMKLDSTLKERDNMIYQLEE